MSSRNFLPCFDVLNVILSDTQEAKSLIAFIFFIDFGVDELIEFKRKTKFPWLMSNVQDKLTKTLLAEGIEKIVAEWHGRKVRMFLVDRPVHWV